MVSGSRTIFTTVRSEGALLPPDLLSRIMNGDTSIGGLRPADYHLEGERINEAINRSWSRLLGVWASFRATSARVPTGDPATGLTRDQWLLKLFQELGYGRLQGAHTIEISNKSYAISHMWGQTPIHLVGFGVDLDQRTAGVRGAARRSPHSLLQELLNASDEFMWGFVSNGLRLRVLRDNATLTRQAYVEFDLEAMFDGQIYVDFVLLWLLCQQSRVETDQRQLCWLEKWSRVAQEQGTRALDQLRRGVEEAITALGRGFLLCRENELLRQKLRSGTLSTQDYYRQLLRLVYRIIFLFVAEDRELLLDPAADTKSRERYTTYYSVRRLRTFAERRAGTRHTDLFHVLLLVMRMLGSDQGCQALGLPALGSFLFSHAAITDLDDCLLTNHNFLEAIRALTFITDRHGRRLVDYKNLASEEIGGIYESLLELHPVLSVDAGTFELQIKAGNDRKTSGAYYTPPLLVSSLLDSALNPVIDDACRKADPVKEILSLKIVDPACGGGSFLIGAAHRLAKRLAAIRSGDEEPSPEAYRTALRDVIGRCIYGVDINPMSVELCKVSLWMEALEPGKPLSFLEHHIQCGNSLIGVTPALLARGIPDAAFDPLTGDDRAVCSEYKKRNKRERTGQLSIVDASGQVWSSTAPLTICVAGIEDIPDDTIAGIHYREAEYERCQSRPEYQMARLIADAWCAAFFLKKTGEFDYPITQEVLLRTAGNIEAMPQWMQQEIRRLSNQHRFFHWYLAFPDVFAPIEDINELLETEGPGWTGGFDAVLGNVPWERIKIQKQEWFAKRRPEIAQALNNAVRERMIRELPEHDYDLAIEWRNALRGAEAESQFVRTSSRYPLTGVGDVNTYAVFAENDSTIMSTGGRVGIIVPTGIATADTTKKFFESLVNDGSLISLYDFLEARDFFHGLESRDPFCLITIAGPVRNPSGASFVFKMLSLDEIRQPERQVHLLPSDFTLLNPNTRTCPIFRTGIDAELTKRIYGRVPVLLDEKNKVNLWDVSFMAMFHMANDSHLFQIVSNDSTVPLYEAKLLHQFTHRWATYNGSRARDLRADELVDPHQLTTPRYWMSSTAVSDRLSERWNRNWLLGWRDIARSEDERSMIATIFPRVGCSDKFLLMFPAKASASLASSLLATLNSLTLDYVVRQKLGSAAVKYFVVKQLPILPPDSFVADDIAYIVPRVLELLYSAWDMQPFAEDVWAEAGESLRMEIVRRNAECNADAPLELFSPRDDFPLPPFRWNDLRRAVIRAELDARIARLYGLTRDEVRYILDPQDVYGAEFPGETFRVLKEKELRVFGEYRTRRLVLEAWDSASPE